MIQLVEATGSESGIGVGYFPESTRLASGGFVVSWLDTIGETETLGRVFDSSGSQIGNFSIGEADNYHSLAPLTGGGFVVVYTTNSQAFAQLFDATGARTGSSLLLGSIDYYSNWNIAVQGLANGGFAASWRDEISVMVSTYNASGSPLALLRPDIGAGGVAPQITELANGTLALAWHEYDSETPGGNPDGYQVSRQIFSADGSAMSAKYIVNQTQVGSHAASKIAALSTGGFVVTWVANGNEAGIKGQLFDSVGNPVGSNLEISDLTPGYQSQADVASLPWGGFLVTWADDSPYPQNLESGIRARLFDGSGEHVGETIRVSAQYNTFERAPSVTVLSDTEAKIFYSSDGSPSGVLGRTIALPRVGTQSDDVLAGSAGNDRIAGLGGDDTLYGIAGNDALGGGSGNDYYFVDSRSDNVTELNDEGFDTVFSSGNFDLAGGSEVEALRAVDPESTSAVDIAGNEFGQVLSGNNGANVLRGLGGADYIEGRDGVDTLDGGTGSDVMRGGAGDDYYFVESLGDRIIEEAGDGFDTIFTSISLRLDADASIEALRAVEVPGILLTLTGNDLGQIIAGNNRANWLYGLGGDDYLEGLGGVDTIDGGRGGDTMRGGTGDDYYFIDSSGDRILESVGEGFDTAFVDASFALEGGMQVEAIRAGNAGSTLRMDLWGNEFGQVIQGNEGVNLLVGYGGEDYLEARGGDDKLDGGAGNDVLIGGAGIDIFAVGEVGFNDRLIDFVSGTDRVDVRGIDADSSAAGDQAFVWVGTDEFTNVAGQLRGYLSDGINYIAGDVDGNGTADFVIDLGSAQVVPSDILF